MAHGADPLSQDRFRKNAIEADTGICPFVNRDPWWPFSGNSPRSAWIAVKFYTEDGNWDLVGNNLKVFFIRDAIKFPDFIHSFKPDPVTTRVQRSP